MTSIQIANKIINSFIIRLKSLKVPITVDDELKQISINEIANDIENYAEQYHNNKLTTGKLSKLTNLKNPE